MKAITYYILMLFLTFNNPKFKQHLLLAVSP